MEKSKHVPIQNYYRSIFATIFFCSLFISPAHASNISQFFSSSGGGKNIKVQTFTASGTWTKPTGVTSVKVIAVGGGGDMGSINAGSGGSGVIILEWEE